ncbi:S24/S26 family peptidase [Natrinema salinisoli]|uniref:S24/S26 family peptidase n=1 Tax=Natrinema salinisoli TaxID=2878535 RepID=UPI001CF0C1F8|nr:S24/S26 family peptidase [Natrinema salinisoli]
MNTDRVATIAALAVLCTVLAALTVIAAHPDFRTATGDSMEPTMNAPIVAHCTDVHPDDIAVDDIVSVNIDGEDIMHRVKTLNGDRLQTAGDGRESSDKWSHVDDVNCRVDAWWSLDPTEYID